MLAGAVTLGLLAAACNTADDSAAGVRSDSAAPSPSASASPSPSPLPALNPLTGLAPAPTGSVVVIKVDNGGLARKYHRGLGRAAIVYEELVEAGETRLAAVYTDGSAGEVGPVRSVRESDIELLRQYGKVPVAFSGGNTGVKATFGRAVRSGFLLDASYDAVPDIYRLGEWRSDARNFFVTPAGVAGSRQGAAPHDIGLHFAPLPAGTGAPAAAAKAVFSQYVTVSVVYVPQTGRWAVTQNQREMTGVAPTNVIVQQVPIRMSKYVDVLGNRTPYTVTLGTGPVTVLRNGVAITGTWSRPSLTAGTSYVDAAGKAIPLKPGPTWVLLLPKGRPLTLS